MRTVTPAEATTLIARYVVPNPYRPGEANARLVDSGIPVWAIFGYLDAVNGDVVQVGRDYTISLEAMEAALAYYHEHREPIDARILLNATQPANLSGGLLLLRQ